MILIAYDGSDDAKVALQGAARLVPGAEAVVLTVWEPYIDGLARAGAVGIGGIPEDAGAQYDKQFAARAGERAADGAELASAAGLTATPRAESSHGSPATTILAVAEELDADAIVLGSRGHGRVASLLLGSTSQHVLHHSTRPVIVVPAPAKG